MGQRAVILCWGLAGENVERELPAWCSNLAGSTVKRYVPLFPDWIETEAKLERTTFAQADADLEFNQRVYADRGPSFAAWHLHKPSSGVATGTPALLAFLAFLVHHHPSIPTVRTVRGDASHSSGRRPRNWAWGLGYQPLPNLRPQISAGHHWFFDGVFPLFFNSSHVLSNSLGRVARTRASLSASMCLLILKGLPVPLEDVGHSSGCAGWHRLLNMGRHKSGDGSEPNYFTTSWEDEAVFMLTTGVDP